MFPITMPYSGTYKDVPSNLPFYLTYLRIQRQQWLREALESVASAPSETDLLKAALAVLQAHAPSKESSGAAPQTDEVKTAVMTAFEDVQYFIEDLDHANGQGLYSILRADSVCIILCSVPRHHGLA